MKTTLTPEMLDAITAKLSQANVAHDATFQGEPGGRQPVHTVYGGAHLFTADVERNRHGVWGVPEAAFFRGQTSRTRV